LPDSYFEGKKEAEKNLQEARTSQIPLKELKTIEKRFNEFPKDPASAYELWQVQKKDAQIKSQTAVPSMDPGSSKGVGDSSLDNLNFILLIFCLMFGTASLPHILTRYYTTTSVSATRYSVFWTLFFVRTFLSECACFGGHGEVGAV